MGRSKDQKAQLRNLNAARAAQAATLDAREAEFARQLALKNSEIAELKVKIAELTSKVEAKDKKYRAKHEQFKRAKLQAEKLYIDRRQLKTRIINRDVRKRARKVREKLERNVDSSRSVSLKEKGVFTLGTRSMVRRLAKENVPDTKVDAVIHIVGEGLGVEVVDHIDARSAGRMVLEAGIAAQMQIVDELRPENCSGHTYSSDGTTIRHRTYEAGHVTTLVPDYKADDGKKSVKTRLFSIHNASNHQSETQLRAIKTVAEGYYELYNKSTLGKENPVDFDTFAALLDALGSDHAEDMKKLARLLKLWKITSKKILLGKEIWRRGASGDLALISMLAKAGEDAISSLGGVEAWSRLSEAQQEKLDEETIRKVWESIGTTEWDSMSAEQKEIAARFIHAGCCMHKELNSVKGGDKGLRTFWATVRAEDRPVKLMNNGVTAMAASTGAQKEAEELSAGGAAKLTSLAGMIFKHKDDKKGQQDFYRSFFEEKLGYAWKFPDTSNTRFQSHCAASAELIVNLPLYLQFLLLVRDKKSDRTFNNMEANVFKGLRDIGTLTEMSVYALYGENFSKIYMLYVRMGGEDRVNALDLGPLHEQVKAHCKKIIADPDLLLRGEEGDYKEATLDGTLWDRPDVVYAVQRLAPSLPHLSSCIKAFLSGALETWERLTSEYAPGGDISQLTSAERDRIFINPTNDHNEGALGTTRLAIRRAGNIATRTIGAKTMYARNDTENFIQKRLNTDEDWAYIKKEARLKDADGSNKRQREEELAEDIARVENKRRMIEQAEEREKEKREKIDNLVPVLDVGVLVRNIRRFKGGLKVPDLRDQLEWHRRIDPAVVLDAKITNNMKRDELLQHLTTVVKIFHKNKRQIPTRRTAPVALEGEQIAVQMTWDEKEEMLDEELSERAVGASN